MDVPPRDFHHPYKPYDIQVELMNAIYDCIAAGKIGIFESPTGTGKSLSIICSSLTWLRNAQDQILQDVMGDEEEAGEPEWAVEQSKIQRKQSMLEQRSELETRLGQIRAKELRQKQRYERGEPKAKRMRAEDTETSLKANDEAPFELEDYYSEDEDPERLPRSHQLGDQGLSSTSMQLMDKLGLSFKQSSAGDDQLPTDELKIYYCSRTHSQITQFIHEVRRVDLPPAPWTIESDNSSVDLVNKQVVKHLPLGSRRNLCVNSSVVRLGSAAAINERCLELQQSDTSKDRKCQFLPRQENEALVNDFRDHALAKIRDIEDLGMLGKKIGICPYYASRAAIIPAEIVTLPYPLLLQKSAREALGISLKGNVVIIDEAHNLMDAISNIYTISVSLAQLKRCRSQLGVYLQKFRNRLKGKNRVYVAQVLRLIDSVTSHLNQITAGKQQGDGIVEVGDLMAGKGVDQINLYKLMRYLQESKLARKVESYSIHTERLAQSTDVSNGAKSFDSTMPVLTHVQSFFEALTNPAAEGRFFYEKDDCNTVIVKYMLLDPTQHFKEIVEDARAVILAGGTMSPMDDYSRHLLTYVDPKRLRTFSCGHIIPRENLIALQVTHGLGGMEFDFTYEKRNTSTMVEMLGEYLIRLSSAIPDGLVVFFPSYSYLNQVIIRWQNKPISAAKSTWDRLLWKKPIFRESRDTSTDDVLGLYSQAISTGQGGLLFSVIGGKLSEGINFSDSLGRGVVVVGLPFPNIQSAQWKAKLEYVEQSTAERSDQRGSGKAAAKELYENSCMRAVNQSIGRAIRHKGDYASIMLLDRRYATPCIEGKLPGWIRQGLVDEIKGRSGLDGIQKVEAFFNMK